MPTEERAKKSLHEKRRPLRERVTEIHVSSDAEVQAADAIQAEYRLAELASIKESARFYSKASARADYGAWACRTWTAEQAVALSLGKDPTIVNRHTLHGYIAISDFAREFFNRGRFVTLHVLPEEAGAVPAKLWVARLEEVGLDLPKALVDAVRGESSPNTANAKSPDTASLEQLQSELSAAKLKITELEQSRAGETLDNPKALKTYDKLVYALSIMAKHDSSKNSPAASTILNALERKGIKMDRGLILKRLDEATARKEAGDFD